MPRLFKYLFIISDWSQNTFLRPNYYGETVSYVAEKYRSNTKQEKN